MAEVRDTAGNVITPAVNVDEDKLERWEIKPSEKSVRENTLKSLEGSSGIWGDSRGILSQ